MSDTTIDTVIAVNAATVRKSQFCQQVKMTAASPAQFVQAQARYTQSVAQLKARILDDATIADLGTDYAAVKASVDAL